MSEFNKLPDHDERSRESKDNEYTIPSASPNGRIVCYLPGMKLIDFYRTDTVLAKDVPVKPVSTEVKP